MTVARTGRLIVMWAVFLGVHALIALLGWIYPSQPMGDVVLVYEPWSASALGGGAIVGVTEQWVYPQLALLPMLVAKLLSLPLVPLLGASGAYLIAWAVLVTALDAVAFGVLLGRTASRPHRIAAWIWSAALFLLGPIAMYRIDAITVPLVVIGGLWLQKRPAVATALLTIGAWVKIWPGAVIISAIIASRTRIRMLLAAIAVTAAVLVMLFLLGADGELLGFLTEQTGRGLQIEAVAATPFLWLVMAGSARIEYSFDILTFQIAAAGADAVTAVLTPLMIVAVLVIAAIGSVKAMRGASFPRLFPPLALALIVALIVTNKVGSPQFQTWLIAPVVLWIILDRVRARVPVVLVLLLCSLTCLIYPLTYDALLRAELVPVMLVSARNILLVVLLAVGIRALVRVPVKP